MKHAIIITAYTDKEQLIKLIDQLCQDFYVFVHIDKKSRFNLNEYKHSKTVFIYSRWKINWGSFNHLKAILFLLKKALKRTKAERFHIISGQDYPILSNEEIKRYFEINKKLNFIDIVKVSDDESLNFRFKTFWFTDWINHPRDWDFFSNNRIKRLYKFQIKKRVDRKRIGTYSINDLYKGLVYSSLTREGVRCCLRNNVDRILFLIGLKFCLIPEEFYFQTLLMNSNLKDTLNNNNLRYTDWSFRDEVSPCVLDEQDYNKVLNSKAIFMRKISGKSNKLIQMLEK